MPNTTTDSAGMATTNVIASRVSIVNAMTAAPSTMNGERKNRRSVRFTPDCTWLMSLVRRVMSVDVPMRSSAVNESACRCRNDSRRTRAANPVAARAAKYCAVIDDTQPTTASPTRIRLMRTT